MIENEIPKPGSKEAEERGCTCPAIDNHYGHGVFFDGVYHWWHNADCPLHLTTEWQSRAMGRADE